MFQAVSGLIRPQIASVHGDENESIRNSLDDGGNIFSNHSSMLAEQHGISAEFGGDGRHNTIIRYDKLLTDGESIAHPDSSDSDYRTSSSSEYKCSTNSRHNFTLNQNVHDSLLNSSSSTSYPPPPPMTCMAPLGSSGKSSGIKRDNPYLSGVSKIETNDDILQDTVEMQLSSSPSSSSWIGKMHRTSVLTKRGGFLPFLYLYLFD